MALSIDFKDDILNELVNTKRKYNVIHNNDGTESYEDVTSYSQTGSQYGAKEVIEEREAINQLQEDVSSLNSALGSLEFIDTATTGNSGGTALSMQNQLKGENLYIIFIRHLNGTDDCYEPYALLLFMRSQNYQYTTLGNSIDLKNTQINEGRLTINFNSAQWARMWVYKIS